MIDHQRVVAVIPARGGSKTVPGKNLRDLAGKPLIVWTLELAASIPEIDRVIVSTDSAEIALVAHEQGAETYLRPASLATDTALVLDAVLDLSLRLGEEGESAVYGLLLEPTSPFRRGADVQACLSRLHRDGLDSVATFKPADLNPHRAWRIQEGAPECFVEGSVPWLPRQQLPEAYQLSGEVYAFRLDRLATSNHGLLFGRTGAVIVDGQASLDIDDERDFRLAELISREGYHAPISA